MSDSEEPKIIVDDDWKEQVAKEKMAADNTVADKTVADMSDESADAAEDIAEALNQDEAPDLPPASLEAHLSMLFTQCLASLGQIPGPDGKPADVNKAYAKLFIDTVEMLQEKTQGNCTDEETQMFGEVLHAMRMAFVNVKAN